MKIIKKALRDHYVQARRNLPADVAEGAAARVAAQVCILPGIATADTVLSYVAAKDRELATQDILAWVLARQATLLVPVCLPQRRLGWSVLRNLEDLAPTSFGILEPNDTARAMVEPPREAPVLVPGLAFDRRGYRLGYGGGYFDRFLARHDGLKVGLGYDLQISPALPREPHDVPMDLIVTESETIRCR